MTLAHREEGLILPRGNPRGVTRFADVVRQRLRIANREAGSGVRVLLDHLLSDHKLGKRGLPGYETELSTHLEVATAVAEERADVGIGVPAPFTPFGFGPNRFAPGWLSSAMKTSSTIAPMIGMRPISTHQPLRSVSCRRRTVTARLGTKIARKPVEHACMSCARNTLSVCTYTHDMSTRMAEKSSGASRIMTSRFSST